MSKKLPIINIIDVNNLLHIGNHRFRNYSIKDVNGFKIPTGGMYMVLNLLRKQGMSPTNNLWIFCFDRHSYRKELGLQLGVEYKTKRSKMPQHLFVQADELYKWLPKIGYNALAFDGLEADDIINSLAHVFKDAQAQVNIFTTDRDHAFNTSDKCSIISSNSKVPSIYKENYESVIAGSRGRKVFYNTVLLYKVICGDESDGIKPIMAESYALYLAVIKKLEEANFPLDALSDFNHVEKTLQLIPSAYREKAEANWEVIKPHIIPKEQIAVQAQKIDEENLRDFCAIFGMNSIAKKFGITPSDFNGEVMKYRLDLYERISDTRDSFDEVDEEENEEESDNRTDIERVAELKKVKQELAGTPLTKAIISQSTPAKMSGETNQTDEQNQPKITSSIDSVD